MKSIKIAIVSPYPPSLGTLNEYVYHLVKHMKLKSDVEEIILLTDEIEEGYESVDVSGGCKITIKPCWSFNSLKNVFNISKAIKSSGADIVLFNIQFLSFGDKKIPASLGLLTPLISRLMGTPSVVLLHNITETVDYESAGITKNPILKWIYDLSGTILTKILLLSNLVTLTIPKYVEIIEKKYKANNVALIPHGSFELPPLPDFSAKEGPISIMTFGKFGTYKKVEKMIDAIEIVRERTNKEINIVIAGTDNPNVEGYLKGVKNKYAAVKGIEYTGYVAEEDVPKLFNSSSFVVFDYTSTTGSSGVLHQAGSYGKAVVIPQIGDLKELIEEEGYMGAYYEAGDVIGMANAIEQLVIDDVYRKKIAMKNYMAAASLPMSDIVDWYLLHFHSKLRKSQKKSTQLASQF